MLRFWKIGPALKALESGLRELSRSVGRLAARVGVNEDRLSIHAEKISEAEAGVARLESLFDRQGAYTGPGIAMPTQGVGAKGFNVAVTEPKEDGTAKYFPGATREAILRDGTTLSFRGGILIDPHAPFER